MVASGGMSLGRPIPGTGRTGLREVPRPGKQDRVVANPLWYGQSPEIDLKGRRRAV